LFFSFLLSVGYEACYRKLYRKCAPRVFAVVVRRFAAFDLDAADGKLVLDLKRGLSFVVPVHVPDVKHVGNRGRGRKEPLAVFVNGGAYRQRQRHRERRFAYRVARIRARPDDDAKNDVCLRCLFDEVGPRAYDRKPLYSEGTYGFYYFVFKQLFNHLFLTSGNGARRSSSSFAPAMCFIIPAILLAALLSALFIPDWPPLTASRA